MSGLGFKQVVVEVSQLAIPHEAPQQIEPYARTGFDQAGDEQPVDTPLRFGFSHQRVQFTSVAAWLESSKRDSAFVEQIQDSEEVIEFFVDDLGHFPAQLLMLDIGVHQTHCRASGLSFAVRVVEQDFVQVLIYLRQPAVGRLTAKA
jgi:hypothetical protein